MGAVRSEAGLGQGPPRSLPCPPLVLMEGCLLAYSQAHPFLPGPKTGKTDDQDLNSVLSEKEVLHALWAVDKEMRKQVLEYLEEMENIML